MVASINDEAIMNLETVAILRSLQLCMHLEISHLIIECDSQVVVKKISGMRSK